MSGRSAPIPQWKPDNPKIVRRYDNGLVGLADGRIVTLPADAIFQRQPPSSVAKLTAADGKETYHYNGEVIRTIPPRTS